ncbi:hypothetical protein Sa4125_17860 [Aureimonas sp. SA4125]|nr:hypothetical protein Sa4125_17860 [Aureimonas sp. SA4125]
MIVRMRGGSRGCIRCMGTIVVIMIVVVAFMIMIVLVMAIGDRGWLAWCGLASDRSGLCSIAEVLHLLDDRLALEIVAMHDPQSSRRDGHRHVINPGKPADGSIDLRCAGGTVHARHPVAGLSRFGVHGNLLETGFGRP